MRIDAGQFVNPAVRADDREFVELREPNPVPNTQPQVRVTELTAQTLCSTMWYRLVSDRGNSTWKAFVLQSCLTQMCWLPAACRYEHSAAYRVLLAVLDRRVPIMLTEGIVAEYEDVLSRPGVRQLTGLTIKQNAELVLELISLSHQTQLHFSWRPNLMDEADNKFIEAAIAASAIIVTYNVRDFAKPDLEKHGWEVMTPIELASLFDLES